MVRLPLLAPAAAELQGAGDPEVARRGSGRSPAGVEDAAVARPGAPQRDRHDVASRRDAVAGRRHLPKHPAGAGPVIPSIRSTDADPAPRRKASLTVAAPPGHTAVRAIVRGDVQGVGFRDATVRRARELGRDGLGAQRRGRQRARPRRGRPRRRSRSCSRSCARARRRRGSPRSTIEQRQGRGPRAVRDPRRQRRRLRRPGARGDRPPLRPAPGGRRGDALVGGAEGPVDGPGGQAPRGRRSRTTRSRHNDFEGATRRRRRDRLGPRHLRAGRPRRLARGARARPRRLRPARREAARRLRAAAHAAAARSPSGC